MANILGVGIATLDIINSVPHYPSEDEELRATKQQFCRGGNVTNTLTVLSQSPHQCFWAGVICNDANAQFINTDLKENHINTQYCKIIENGSTPTSYITLNQQNGSRTIVHYRDLPELLCEDFKKIPLHDFDWIHFEARVISENIKMIQWVKQQFPKTPVSLEIEKPRDGIKDILQEADMYLYSKHFATAIGFEDGESFIKSRADLQQNKDIICTWGEKGAYANTTQDGFIHQPAFTLNKAVDTLGAGDTFNAGIIHSRIKQYSWKDSLQIACQLAAKKCGQQGFTNLGL